MGLASLRPHVPVVELVPQHRLVAHDQTETEKEVRQARHQKPPVESLRGGGVSDLAALLVGTPRKCMASLHRNSLTDERMTARPSPDLPQVVRKERVRGGKGCSEPRNASQTLNMEFSRILSAVVPKLRRSFDGFRVLDVGVA